MVFGFLFLFLSGIVSEYVVWLVFEDIYWIRGWWIGMFVGSNVCFNCFLDFGRF